MAIVFTKQLSTSTTLMAYNNNVVRFASDNPEDALTCDITIGAQTVTIYPTPDGDFYFNFKDYVIPIVNQTNFVDTVSPNLNPVTPTTYTYIGSGYNLLTVTYTIHLADDSDDVDGFDYTFLAGVEQIETYKKNVTQTGDNIVLLPLFPNTNNKYYCKYWEGYPFDISFLQWGELIDNLEITNNTNLLDFEFIQKGNITRLFFCDGSTDETINDLLPIALGLNELAWSDKFVYVDKQDVCSGVYVKWFNQYGGYSYWLFPNIYQRSQNQKNIGELNTDFEDLSDTFSQTTQIGMTAGEKLIVNSDKLTSEEFNLLKGILTSPKVYLFTGEPFSQADSNDWMEVKVTTTEQRTRNYKGQALDITLALELPDLYTQTL